MVGRCSRILGVNDRLGGGSMWLYAVIIMADVGVATDGPWARMLLWIMIERR